MRITIFTGIYFLIFVMLVSLWSYINRMPDYEIEFMKFE